MAKSTDTPLERTTLVLSVNGAEANAELVAIAAALRVSKAQALRDVIALGAIVYADAEAARFNRPADALSAYVRGRGGSLPS